MCDAPPDTTALPTASAGDWQNLKDVEEFVYLSMRLVGLDDWVFGWHRSVRKLGFSLVPMKRISLSIYYVEQYLHEDKEAIRRTILHEIAHALAWEFDGTMCHNKTWHRFCEKLGIGDETRCAKKPMNIHPKNRKHRYVLCLKETGEIFMHYAITPVKAMKNLKHLYIRNRREETYGKLSIVDLNQETLPGQS